MKIKFQTVFSSLIIMALMFVSSTVSAKAAILPLRLSATAPKSITQGQVFNQSFALINPNSFLRPAILPFKRTVFFPSDVISNVQIVSVTNGTFYKPVITAEGVTYSWVNSGYGLRMGTASIVKLALTANSTNSGDRLKMMSIADVLGYSSPAEYFTSLLSL
ncbi:MAG: hypothetical protein WAV41_05570 [Microgenomates group bacterium]